MSLMARRLALVGIVGVVLGLALTVPPVLRAAGLVARAAQTGGWMEALARRGAARVDVRPASSFVSRHGPVRIQVYEPAGGARRTTLLVPGIHSMGIHEPRLVSLAAELAGSGVRVVTLAPPDLTTYTITPRATDAVEDAVSWAAGHADWAPDGKIGVIGISFAGGLSIVAAGRHAVRDKVAFVVSFGGHGDLPRVMRYLATGQTPTVPGLPVVPPHDYGVAVLLYGLAPFGVVPGEQAAGLRDAIATYLRASQLTLVDMTEANASFARAREMAAALAPPASTYMAWVNDRNVGKLGPVLLPLLDRLGAEEPSVSPERTTTGLPSARVYLLHGSDHSVIPTAESILLAADLRGRGADVRMLTSNLITHAEVNRSAGPGAVWQLVSFWADVLRR